MFRPVSVIAHILKSTRTAVNLKTYSRPVVASQLRCYSSKKEETDEQFDARWEAYFNRPEIDDWEIRRGLNELHGHDLVPEPKIVAAALRACRRLNDSAMTVRILEAVKDKAANHKNIYPYMLQELRPVLDELSISTPEELGLDKPQADKIN